MLGDYHMFDCKNEFATDLFWIKNVFRIILLETVPSIVFVAFFDEIVSQSIHVHENERMSLIHNTFQWQDAT